MGNLTDRIHPSFACGVSMDSYSPDLQTSCAGGDSKDLSRSSPGHISTLLLLSDPRAHTPGSKALPPSLVVQLITLKKPKPIALVSTITNENLS